MHVIEKLKLEIDCVRYTKDERGQEIEKEIFTDGFRYGTRHDVHSYSLIRQHQQM